MPAGERSPGQSTDPFSLSNNIMGWFLDAKMFSAITSAELCELVSHLFLIFFPDADEGELVKSGRTDQQGENSADNISTFSFLTPNQSSKSYLQKGFRINRVCSWQF